MLGRVAKYVSGCSSSPLLLVFPPRCARRQVQLWLAGKYGAPGETRTPNLRVRSPELIVIECVIPQLFYSTNPNKDSPFPAFCSFCSLLPPYRTNQSSHECSRHLLAAKLAARNFSPPVTFPCKSPQEGGLFYFSHSPSRIAQNCPFPA